MMWSRYRDPLAKNRAFVKYARRRVTGTPDYPTETGGIFSGSISRFVHGDRSALKRKSIRLVSVVILILDLSVSAFAVQFNREKRGWVVAANSTFFARSRTFQHLHALDATANTYALHSITRTTFAPITGGVPSYSTL